MSAGRPVFEDDGREWPHRDASRFVEAAGLTFHVQQMGAGPPLLLVHGTGAATHSFRALMPLLAGRFAVTSADLPGHGFSDPLPPGGATLPGMAAALGALLRTLGVAPAIAVGHSAGAAIVLRMVLDGLLAPRAVIAVNGALLPFRGLAGQLFSPLARMLVLNPFLPRLVAWGAGGRAAVERLVRDTGSELDAEGIDLYLRLLQRPEHVAGALRMMANWDLTAFATDLPHVSTPLVLVVGAADKAISPEEARRVRALVPGASIETVRAAGHLVHEERPVEVAAIVLRTARQVAAIP